MTKAISKEQYLMVPSEELLRPLKLLTAGGETHMLCLDPLAGVLGLAGAVSRTLTAPIDRLKMILMVNNESSPRNLTWGINKMLAEGSPKALFKGNGTNVLKIAPETAIKLAVTDSLKKHIVQDPERIHPMERLICGGIAGATAQFTIFPLEVIRTRLATATSGTYNGLIECGTRIYNKEGLLAFYRGLGPNMVGIFPYAGVEIACFEILMNKLTEKFNGNPPDALIVSAGTCSAILAQFISYPCSLVKIRLQAQGVDNAPREYNGMINCFAKILRNEGYRGLYKGLLPNFIKLAPAAGTSWLVFEKTKKFLGLNGRE
eukprot:g589.t1